MFPLALKLTLPFSSTRSSVNFPICSASSALASWIARFDQKKDHRELQTTSGGNVFTFKSGLSKDRTPDIQIDGVDSSTFLISPKASLTEGEYLLSTTSMGMSGYDFGFHPMKATK